MFMGGCLYIYTSQEQVNEKFWLIYMNTIIEQNKKTINDLCSRHHVKKLYAFGSVVTDKFSNVSDVYMVVDFDKVDLEKYADNYFDLKFALEDLFKKEIDLLEEQAITNPYRRKKIDEQKQLIYDAVV
jgi:predicted nucleotidyltransferase